MAPVYEPDRDFYKLLGLKPTTASNEQIVRQAYLKCARKAHPDRDRTNNAATGNFQDVQEAYETLRDPTKKTKYDKAILEWSRKEDQRKMEEARKREDEAWARSRSRRRAGPAPFGQFGQEKYFPYDARAPKPTASSKPPPGASTAWEEMKRARSGRPGQSTSQSQKPANPPQRPGPHPTAKTPKKPASQRQGSFAQWAKDHPGGPETPGKNGYRPTSSAMGDEPAAKNNSYSSAKKTDYFSVHDESDSDNIESILKSRPSQPYPKVYGEKTKLFEEQVRSAEEKSRGDKQAKTASTPRKDGQSAGTQPFWPHPETHPEFSGAKSSEGENPTGHTPFERTPNASPGPWFTKEAPPGAFTFTAGSETSAEAPPVRKTKSSGHLGRKNTASPTKRRRPETAESPAQPGEPAPQSPNPPWDPKVWSQTFGPQDFFPGTTRRSPTSVSPTRQTPSNLKRSATMGPSSSSASQRATATDDTSVDEGGAGLRGDPPKTASAAHVPSPNAMDIDSPPHRPSTGPTPTAGSTPARASSTRTRAVPVEPSKPEWRAGAGAGQAKEASKKPAPPPKPTMGGSEDTDDFRTTFDELKNVPPFAPQGGGLGGLGDLKFNLPFSSKPSESIPVKPASYKPLELPKAPMAPVFPAAVGTNGIRPTRDIVQTYVRAFESYLAQWDSYIGIIVGHFKERQDLMSKEVGGGNLGAAKRRIRERLGTGRQDARVRREWSEACEQHERRLEEHLRVLEKMGAV